VTLVRGSRRPPMLDLHRLPAWRRPLRRLVHVGVLVTRRGRQFGVGGPCPVGIFRVNQWAHLPGGRNNCTDSPTPASLFCTILHISTGIAGIYQKWRCFCAESAPYPPSELLACSGSPCRHPWSWIFAPRLDYCPPLRDAI